MSEEQYEKVPPWNLGPSDERNPSILIPILVVCIIGGVLTGFVGAAFRWTLTTVDKLRVDMVEWAQQWSWLGILIPIAVSAIAIGLARLITTYVPAAAGSGVQRVEGAMNGVVPLEQGRIVPAKFIGGVLAIGGGAALGREGPTVQMGASIGSKLSKWFKLPRASALTVEASLAGAGLGVAFNAPLGGMFFVFEEATKRIGIRLLIGTMAGGAAAILVARAMLGNIAEFTVPSVGNLTPIQIVFIVIFGVLMGAMGAWYNKSVVWWGKVMNSATFVRPEIRAAIIGGAIGAVGWFAPTIVGGGDNLAQQMFTATPGMLVVIGLLLFRWIIGPLSYSLGTPGGLFSPLLAVGAIAGTLFAMVMNFLPGVNMPIVLFAFIGMAGLFAGVVRAPITGTVICVEMAMSTEYLIPAMAVSAIAVITATLMRSEPIYTTLLGQLLASQRQQEERNRARDAQSDPSS